MRPSAAVLTYTQDVDSGATPDDSCNELTVEVCDAGGGYYLVMRTARWAIDDPEELVTLLRQALALCEGPP